MSTTIPDNFDTIEKLEGGPPPYGNFPFWTKMSISLNRSSEPIYYYWGLIASPLSGFNWHADI